MRESILLFSQSDSRTSSPGWLGPVLAPVERASMPRPCESASGTLRREHHAKGGKRHRGGARAESDGKDEPRLLKWVGGAYGYLK